MEAIEDFFMFILYYGLAASSLLMLKFILKPPREVFRKMLHLACVLSIFVLVYGFSHWVYATGASLAFAVLVYPVLSYAERYPKFMDLLIQRREGEIKNSLLLVFAMMAFLIAVLWGFFGPDHKYIVILSVLAWGLGDAAAALVGKSIGKHRFRHKWIDPKKTWEGGLAMYGVAALVVVTTLIIGGGYAWQVSIFTGLAVGFICALTELVSHNGLDTLTVPVAAAGATVTILQLIQVMGA